MVMFCRHVVIQKMVGQVGETNSLLSPADLRVGPHKYANLMWQDPSTYTFRQPTPDDVAFFLCIVQNLNSWRWAIENRYSVAPIFGIAIYICYSRAEQSVRLAANLVRRSVIDPERAGSPTNIDSQ